MSEYLDDYVEPVHADSFFSVSRTGEIHERLSFEYLDPEGYYRQVIRDENLLSKEVEKLANNMQYYLDKERVEINTKRVRSEITYCDIYLKGPSEIASILYLIDFSGEFVQGSNRIETWLEEEDAPYDFEIIWKFPLHTKITEVETIMEYEIYDEVLSLWAYEGEEVGGYERLVFEI